MSSCERDISNGEHNISATVNERVTVCVLALHTEACHGIVGNRGQYLSPTN